MNLAVPREYWQRATFVLAAKCEIKYREHSSAIMRQIKNVKSHLLNKKFQSSRMKIYIQEIFDGHFGNSVNGNKTQFNLTQIHNEEFKKNIH